MKITETTITNMDWWIRDAITQDINSRYHKILKRLSQGYQKEAERRLKQAGIQQPPFEITLTLSWEFRSLPDQKEKS